MPHAFAWLRELWPCQSYLTAGRTKQVRRAIATLRILDGERFDPAYLRRTQYREQAGPKSDNEDGTAKTTVAQPRVARTDLARQAPMQPAAPTRKHSTADASADGPPKKKKKSVPSTAPPPSLSSVDQDGTDAGSSTVVADLEVEADPAATTRSGVVGVFEVAPRHGSRALKNAKAGQAPRGAATPRRTDIWATLASSDDVVGTGSTGATASAWL